MTEEGTKYGLTADAREELESRFPRHRWSVDADDEWAVMLVPPEEKDYALFRRDAQVPEEKSTCTKVLATKMVVYVWDKWNGGATRDAAGSNKWTGPSTLPKFSSTIVGWTEGVKEEFGSLIGYKTKKRGEG